jgi:hypothetical protein
MVIKTLDPELDPDPQLEKMLDPHEINADPHPCKKTGKGGKTEGMGL